MIPKSLRAAVPALITLALSVPPVAAAQRHRGDAPATGGAVSRESAPPPAPAGGGGGSPRSGATAAAPSSGGDSGQSSPRGRQGGGGQARGGARTRDTAGSDHERANGGRSDSGRDGDAVPSSSRPREGRTATGQAVARRPGSGGGGTIIVPGGYYYGDGFYPWGWGGLGFGGYYGWPYDSWGYAPYGYGPYQSYGYSSGYEGALRLKVKPRDASVFVDGYFAGRVDEFDGIFQRLHLEAGPHRVEIREDGYEPLTVEVRIQPDRTVTYSGELKRIQ
jgi:PEGA domain